MKKVKISLVLNILIVLFVIIGCFFMFTGIKFMKETMLLSSTKIGMLRFYTVDSNILMGLTSILFIIFDIKVLKGKIEKIPTWVHNVKLFGTSGVTLTFLVTACFLGPLYGYYAMYNNSNLLFHLVVPLLSISSFIFTENYEVKYKYSFIGIISMIIYGIYYMTNVMLHLVDGKPTWEYDFYGFLFGNVWNAFITLPIIFIITYLISLFIIFLNKKFLK